MPVAEYDRSNAGGWFGAFLGMGFAVFSNVVFDIKNYENQMMLVAGFVTVGILIGERFV